MSKTASNATRTNTGSGVKPKANKKKHNAASKRAQRGGSMQASVDYLRSMQGSKNKMRAAAENAAAHQQPKRLREVQDQEGGVQAQRQLPCSRSPRLTHREFSDG